MKLRLKTVACALILAGAITVHHAESASWSWFGLGQNSWAATLFSPPAAKKVTILAATTVAFGAVCWLAYKQWGHLFWPKPVPVKFSQISAPLESNGKSHKQPVELINSADKTNAEKEKPKAAAEIEIVVMPPSSKPEATGVVPPSPVESKTAEVIVKAENGAYLCVKNADGQTRVVRVEPKKNSKESAEIGMTLYQRLCAPSDTCRLKELIGGVDINAPQDEKNNTLLHLACKEGRCSLILFLLDNGADLRVKNADGQTPVVLATQSGLLASDQDAKEVWERFARKAEALRVSSELVDEFTQQVLDRSPKNLYVHLADLTKMGKINEARALIRQIKDINVPQDKEGHTLLHLASAEGIGILVALLLEHKDININAEADAFTPLMLAIIGNHREIVKLLLARPEIDVNHGDGEAGTALCLAVLYNNPNALKLLLERSDVKVNGGSFDQKTALHLAVKMGNEKLVELLLQHWDIDANATRNALRDDEDSDEEGEGDEKEARISVLYDAVKAGKIGVIERLLATEKTLMKPELSVDKPLPLDENIAREIFKRLIAHGDMIADGVIRKEVARAKWVDPLVFLLNGLYLGSVEGKRCYQRVMKMPVADLQKLLKVAGKYRCTFACQAINVVLSLRKETMALRVRQISNENKGKERGKKKEGTPLPSEVVNHIFSYLPRFSGLQDIGSPQSLPWSPSHIYLSRASGLLFKSLGAHIS